MIYSMLRILILVVLFSQCELYAQEVSIKSTQARKAIRKFEKEKAKLDQDLDKEIRKLKSAYVETTNEKKEELLAELEVALKAEAEAVNLDEANKLAAVIEKYDTVEEESREGKSTAPANEKMIASSKTYRISDGKVYTFEKNGVLKLDGKPSFHWQAYRENAAVALSLESNKLLLFLVSGDGKRCKRKSIGWIAENLFKMKGGMAGELVK